MTRVLVTDAGRGSAVAFIRSLAAAGHHVTVGDTRWISAGRWSRWAASSFRYPDPFLDPNGAADAILSEVVEQGVEVLLPMTDATTKVAESLRGRLPSECVIGVPPAAAAAVAADKNRTIRLARELGVPVPVTTMVRSASEAREAAPALGWPIVVKPVSSLVVGAAGTMHKLDVGYGFDPDDLERKVGSLGRGAPVLLQECCTGDGVGVEVLVDRGRVFRAFSHRRLHEVPVTGGASALREAIPVDPELLGHTERLMEALEWNGLAMVEFKAGSDGPRLMEINGRVWGSLPLAVRAGVDFPADYVHLLTRGADGLGVSQDDYAIGTVARNLQLEVVWIGSVLRGPKHAAPEAGQWPPRRAALGAAVRLFSPRIGDDVLSWRDPRASVAELLSIGTKLIGKVRSS